MKKKTIVEQDIISALKNVPDPELGVSIYDLGLYYGSEIDKDNNIEIVMTLTTIGCPLFGTIEEMMRDELKKIDGIKKISIELTFDPPWDADKMTEEGKIALGF